MLLTGALPVSVEFRPVTGGLPVSGIETHPLGINALLKDIRKSKLDRNIS